MGNKYKKGCVMLWCILTELSEWNEKILQFTIVTNNKVYIYVKVLEVFITDDCRIKRIFPLYYTGGAAFYDQCNISGEMAYFGLHNSCSKQFYLFSLIRI